MPDIDASIPLGFKQPDAMQSLSGLLNVAKSQQELQNNAMTLNERKAIGQFMSDPANITDDKGNLDIGKLQAGISRYAPTTGYKYGQAAVDFHKAHTEAQRAANSLTAENKGQIGQTMYATLQDPKMPLDVVDKTFDALGDQLKGGKPLTDYYKTIHQHIYNEQGPDAALQFRKQLAESTQTPTTQQNINSGALAPVGTKDGTQFVQTKTGAAQPQGSQVGPTLAPPNAIVTTPTGRSGTMNPATGQYQDATAGAPAGAPPAPPVNFPVGESQKTFDEFTNKRTATNNAAGTVAEQQFNNNQVIKLAKTARLGQDYGGLVKGFTGHFAGLPGTAQGTIDYDKIEHFLALQQGTLANQAGFNSDASRAIADRQAGSAHGTAEGVTSIARTNRALALGADLYNRGNEKAISDAGGSVFAQRKFQQDWSHTVDFDALRLYDAKKNKEEDPEGWDAIVHELGGVKSKRFSDALDKIGPMRKLVVGQ